MKVLLINPGESGEGASYGALSNPILGLAYLATYLHKNGIDVEVYENSAYRLILSQLKMRIDSFKPDVVAISAKTFNILDAYQIADISKEVSNDILVILGGPHPTALVENTLSECHNVDAVVRGEGEETLLAICKKVKARLKNKDDVFSDIEGVTYRDRRGDLVYNPDRKLITDLDSLPFPDYSLYNRNKFGRVYDSLSGRFESEMSIFASRGCPFKCSFCMPVLGRTWRSRSPENVVAEIDYNLQRYGIRRIIFNDSTFGVNKQWFRDLCRLLRNSGLNKKIHWGFETRVDLASQDLFEEAVSAGAFWVFFGFESGSDIVLKMNGKGITRAQITAAVSAARKAKVATVSGGFILGLPYETKETIKETLELIPELNLDFAGSNIVSIYPGTELWDMVDRGEGGISWLPGMRMNWRKYDRTTCQTKVNDLNEKDILTANTRVKTLGMHTMKKQSLFSYARKANTYFWYHLVHDRKKLLYYIRWGLHELIANKLNKSVPH